LNGHSLCWHQTARFDPYEPFLAMPADSRIGWDWTFGYAIESLILSRRSAGATGQLLAAVDRACLLPPLIGFRRS
jgi:hypothetical protein